MNSEVHILATCRKASLLDRTLLVFKTLRIGFPSTAITVWGNCLRPEYDEEVKAKAIECNCAYNRLHQYVSHDRWIETLLNNQVNPFWICDTDIVFFRRIEAWLFDDSTLFSGQLEPSFREEWTKTLHIERLHTSLMFFNPVNVRIAIRKWMCKIPALWMATAEFPLVRQTFVPTPEGTVFYDTCAALYHAIGGTPFVDEQLEWFEHLHCATYSDLIEPHMSVKGMSDIHKVICDCPTLAKGIRKQQNEYYESRK